ncbi:E3 ubiquitin-protein ligase RNF144A [Spatholobus suberectus]|nr:E3 ubiquitin-protein ligase RNF144A [Spatholobus suberectus]
MFFKPNRGVNRHQPLLTLIQLLNNLIKPIRAWFQLQNLLKRKTSQFRCGICFDYKPVSDMFKKGKCNHPFCTDCMSKHVATQIHQNILKVICPNPNCSVELKPEYLHTILPSEVIVRWESVRCESLIDGSEKIYCPFRDCSVLLVDDGREVVTSAECPSCHRLFCAQCRVPWHGRMTCKEFQRSKRNKGEKELDNKFFKLAKEKKWQKCPNPNCTMYVQRRDGCEHITCRCGCNFCYNCGEIWKFGHQCKKRQSTWNWNWLQLTRNKRF